MRRPTPSRVARTGGGRWPRVPALALALALGCLGAAPPAAARPEEGAPVGVPAPAPAATPAPEASPEPAAAPGGEFTYEWLVEEIEQRRQSATPTPAPTPPPRGPVESPPAEGAASRHLFVEAGVLFHAPRAGAPPGAARPWSDGSDGETRPWAALLFTRRDAWASGDGGVPAGSWRRLEWEARLAFAGQGRGESGAVAPGAGVAAIETELWWPLGTGKLSSTVLGSLGPDLLYSAIADGEVEGLRDSLGFGLTINLVLHPDNGPGQPPHRLTQVAASLLAASREEPDPAGPVLEPDDAWPMRRRWSPLVRLLVRQPAARTGALVLDTRFAPSADFGAWSFAAAWSLPLPVVLGE